MRRVPVPMLVIASLLAPLLLAARPAPVPEAAPVRYQLGLLWRGSAWTAERSPRTDSMQVAHLANIGRMFEERVLVGAGPFEGGADLRGLFLFRADTTFDLGALLARDPAISGGRLRLELMPLLAPRGIGEAYRAAKAAGRPDSMIVVSWVFLRRGPSWTSNVTPQVRKVLEKHRDYTAQLHAEGRLPFMAGIEGTGDLRGVFVFRGDTAEARRLTDLDPAFRSGRFRAEIHAWWTALGTLPGF